ncbi:MAG: DUF3365 domain-containing protein [Cyanobacterium sp. T60_A2020_053]|nr:DUF3365 domain-containing protein [Cyanobacterium sp. T60_A2020_053]
MRLKKNLFSKYHENLKLGQKLTFILLSIFVMGSILCGLVLSNYLNYTSQREITFQAKILMNTMNSVRNYTSLQIQPQLDDRLDQIFLPQTVPAYSATEVFNQFRASPEFGQFYYKEATLNPTNPRDQADDFETQIIEQFKQSNNLKFLQGFRQTSNGETVFYSARPLRVNSSSCLECHSDPSIAPLSMIRKYGQEGGFGWYLDKIVGAQVLSAPASTVIEGARQSFFWIMLIVVGIFGLVLFTVNYWLRKNVISPMYQQIF